ncbi:hypothetical protein AB0D89_13995 [Streptomyces luteogriseus]|nr:hypothetical protein [Streptomyces sp. NRRL S-475]
MSSTSLAVISDSIRPTSAIANAYPGRHQRGLLLTGELFFASSVAALDAIETKYEQRGKTVEIIGLNDLSAGLHGKLTGELTS